MSRDEASRIADMIEACARIQEYTSMLGADGLRSDRRTVDAVLRNVSVLGEAAKHVPESVRSRAADVPWREIAGMRDVLIHDHFGVDLDVVCDVALQKVPVLQRLLERLLRDLSAGQPCDPERP